MESHLDYHAHNNEFRDINTTLKVLFAILTLLICLASTSPIIPLFIFILVPFLLIFMAKIPSKVYLKFISIPFFFAFLTLIYMAFFFGVSDPWIALGSLGPINLVIYRDGLQLGFLVFSRILGAFSCLVFLAFTTPMTELFSILHRIKLPAVLVEISMLMYRFIFLFMDETSKMRDAQKTRMGYRNVKGSFRSMGMLAANLFIRTWFQGEKLHIAMESRGYDGTLKIISRNNKLSARSLTLLISFEAFLIIGTYLTWGLKLI